MSVVVDSKSLKVVAGHQAALYTVLTVPVDRIKGVRHGKVQGGFTAFNGVELTVLTDSGEEVYLPFVVTGAGVGGLFARNATDVAELAKRIRDTLSTESE